MLEDVLAGAVIWVVGAAVLYWNLEGRGVFPSNDHVRVFAVCWPFAMFWGLGWSVLKAIRWFTKSAVVDTVVAFHKVGDWRYHEGRILAAPKQLDEHDQKAREEVDQLLEES